MTFPPPPEAVVARSERRGLIFDHPHSRPQEGEVAHAAAPQLDRATLCEVADGQPLRDDEVLWIVGPEVKHPVTCQACLELVHA